MNKEIKEIGNKKSFKDFYRHLNILSLRFKTYNIRIDNLKDLKTELKELGLNDFDNTYLRLLKNKYPIVFCGYCLYENKKSYFYCSLKRSYNTYGSNGLYTLNLDIEVLENE